MGAYAVKRTPKGVGPATLANYQAAVPNGTWDDMRNDALWNGMAAYQDCRFRTVTDQGGICAFCEIDIRDNHPLKCRVEHFHSKSDVGGGTNWALDWQNMLATCNGGTNPHVSAPGFALQPVAKNLSCDAHKDLRIQSGRLPIACEGWILNPLQILASPSLFTVRKDTGFLEPDPAGCQAARTLNGNKHATISVLVAYTIEMLNLNCDRLATARLLVVRDIENSKKRLRQKGLSPQTGLDELAQRYFGYSWPRFFTVLRVCLGAAAENHLQQINYQG